jgi:hypothetical protein
MERGGITMRKVQALPLRRHHSVTAERIIDAVERRMHTLDNPGFCVACGHEQDGCEPDMRRGICEACGAAGVYGAEELLWHVKVRPRSRSKPAA